MKYNYSTENLKNIPSIITKEYVNTVVKERRADIHKGDCGKVLIAAGSIGMAGAAVLAGLGAYRAGSGLVRISIDEELFPIVQVGLKEATCVPRNACLGDLSQFDAIGIGPGLGDDEKNAKIIEHILENYTKIAVLDADALNTVSRAASSDGGQSIISRFKASGAKIILTPHEGEAARLLGISYDAFKKIERAEAAALIAQKYSAVTVLKGAGTLVTSPDGESYINSTGNAGMATGGSGDVLTGIITSLAGQGLDAADAARAGVYIHGLAGELGAEALSQHGLIAGDIATFTALAIKKIIGK